MTFYYDVNSNQFVTSPYDSTPVLNINLTRGDVVPFEIGFVQNNNVIALPSGTNISLGFKQGGAQNFSGAYMAYASAFSVDNSQQYSPLYSSLLSLANTGIDSLFTGVTPVRLVGQLAYGISGVTEISSYSITASIQDDINKPYGSYPANSFVSFPTYFTGASGIETTVSGKTLVISDTGNYYPANNPSGFLTLDFGSYTFTGNSTVNISHHAPLGAYYVNFASGLPNSYTGNLCLQGASGLTQINKINLSYPVSGHQTFNLYDTSTSGNLLFWNSGDSSLLNIFIDASYTGTNWRVLNANYVLEPMTSFRVCE